MQHVATIFDPEVIFEETAGEPCLVTRFQLQPEPERPGADLNVTMADQLVIWHERSKFVPAQHRRPEPDRRSGRQNAPFFKLGDELHVIEGRLQLR